MMIFVIFKEWMSKHYSDGVKSKDEMSMVIYSFGQFVMRTLRDYYDIDIEERGDEV